MKQLDFVEQADQPAATANGKKPAKAKRKNRPAGSRDDTPLQRLNMEIPKALHKRLKLKAIYEDRTVTDLVLQAINEYLHTH